MESIIIKTSKPKIILAIIIALAFEVFSICTVIMPEKFVSFFFKSEKIIWLVGLVIILLSSLSLIYLFKRLIGNNIALIISEEGITDNTNASSIGFIPWKDIKNIKRKRVASTDFLFIEIRDSNKYILKSKNFFSTRIMKMNLRYYGTPITLNSNSLKYDFDDLQKNILEFFDKWKSNN